MDDNAVDVALIAWREEGVWQVEALTPRSSESLDAILMALRHQPGDGGSLALVSVAEEFFLIVRALGAEPKVLLSDELAAIDWPLAAQALMLLGIEQPDDDEQDDDGEPAGDLSILADLGVSAVELELLCEDLELYPDEALATIATRIGFGDKYSVATATFD